MPPAAFAVHQLRYWLAFGGHAGAELTRQGHTYLHSAAPWLAVAMALGAGVLLRALGHAFSGQRSFSRYTVSFIALWVVASACLIAIYTGQELLEGIFAAGHPAGLAGVFGYGGWWAVPAALAVGLVLAAVFHGARWALAAATELAARRTFTLRRAPSRRTPFSLAPPRLTPLADGWSDRGPPR